MKNQIQNIKDKVSGKSKEYNLLDSWHYLMIHYGWIPFEEFKKMDAHLVDELVSRLNKLNEQRNKPIKGRK